MLQLPCFCDDALWHSLLHDVLLNLLNKINLFFIGNVFGIILNRFSNDFSKEPKPFYFFIFF